MVGPHRQGAAAQAAPEPQMRTPERQALAQAIVNRDHVAGLVESRRAFVETFLAKKRPLYAEEERLEEEMRQPPVAERDRLTALLRGEEPDGIRDKVAVTKDLAEVTAKLDAIRDEERRAEADVRLLEQDLTYRESVVRDCIRDVVITDPATAAVAAELEVLVARRALLGRAAAQALCEIRPGQPTPRAARYVNLIVPAPSTPCPWAAAKARLTTDPDAVLPMPADVP